MANIVWHWHHESWTSKFECWRHNTNMYTRKRLKYCPCPSKYKDAHLFWCYYWWFLWLISKDIHFIADAWCLVCALGWYGPCFWLASSRPHLGLGMQYNIQRIRATLLTQMAHCFDYEKFSQVTHSQHLWNINLLHSICKRGVGVCETKWQ